MARTGADPAANRQLSLSQLQGTLIAALKPVAPELVAVADAFGAILAAPVRASHSMPREAIALRAGYAVTALDLVGASPYSPVMLGTVPTRVLPGEALPPGCTAVVLPDAVTGQGAFVEITHSPAPGDFARRAGHDLAAEALLADQGALVSPRLHLAMTLAKIERVAIVRPRLAVPDPPQPGCLWLTHALHALGCAPIPETEKDTAHLALGWSDENAATLALRPGEGTTIHLETGVSPRILLPRRFDGMIAAFFALVLPAIAHLSGRRMPHLTHPLARKIASSVGVTDVVLLKITPDGFVPLSTGEITLAMLVEADALALIPAESEGLSAGSLLPAIPLDFTLIRTGQP